MAEGTGLTGRDMFTRAYMKGLFPYAIPMEDDMKFVYADNTPVIVNAPGVVPPTGWVEVDVRGVTSEKAVAIFLQARMIITAWAAPPHDDRCRPRTKVPVHCPIRSTRTHSNPVHGSVRIPRGLLECRHISSSLSGSMERNI